MTVRGENISFGYHNATVLDNVSISLGRGETTILAGPNGSGKTTLLKCLAGLLRVRAGTVCLGDVRLEQLSVRRRAQLLAYMPQQSRVTFPVTVFDLVLSGRRPHLTWRPSARDCDIAWKMMERVGLLPLASRSVDELSGGETQKVFIARTLSQDAPIMLFDEPTSGLDVRHQLEIMELFKRVAGEENRTVAVTSHDLNLAARYGDRLYLMKNGAIVGTGRPEATLTPETIRFVYQVKGALHEGKENPHVVCSSCEP